jgi:hypothetical protein
MNLSFDWTENQKVVGMFELRFLEKNGPIQLKVSLFVGHAFSLERDNKPHLEFYMAKVVFLIHRMMSWLLVFCGFCAHWNRSLFSGLVECSEKQKAQV